VLLSRLSSCKLCFSRSSSFYH